jgi:hypothetical protein
MNAGAVEITKFQSRLLDIYKSEHSNRISQDTIGFSWLCNLKILRGKPEYIQVDWHALFTGGIQRDCRGSQHRLERPKGVLAAVGHVEEAVLVLVLLVNGRHQGSCKQRTIQISV